MLGKTIIAEAVGDASATTAVEMNTTPNLPGTKVLILIEMLTNPTMTGVVEGSPDGTTWTDLVNTGAINITSGAIPAYSKAVEVVLPKFIRVNNSAWTDGTLNAYVLNAN